MHDLITEIKYHAKFALLKCLKGKNTIVCKESDSVREKVTGILKEGNMWKENKNFWCLKLNRYHISNIFWLFSWNNSMVCT